MGGRDLFWPFLLAPRFAWAPNTRDQVCRLLYVVFFTVLLWDASRQAQQTIYFIRKRPREQWDPTLWEVPLQPLPKQQKAHWDPNEWEIPLT